MAATNATPNAADVEVTTDEDNSVGLTLAATDVDNDLLNYVIVSLPQHGTLCGTAPNATYTPTANYFGPDSFR